MNFLLSFLNSLETIPSFLESKLESCLDGGTDQDTKHCGGGLFSLFPHLPDLLVYKLIGQVIYRSIKVYETYAY